MPDDVPYCTCAHLHKRQDGYTCINVETNDWGCGTCKKPTQMYWQNVIRPREEAHATTHATHA